MEFSYPMDRTLSLQIALPLAMRDWLNEFMHSILRISKKSTLAEQRLRQSEERFMKAFHASPLPISISTQAEARFVEVNDAETLLVISIFGQTPPPAPGCLRNSAKEKASR